MNSIFTLRDIALKLHRRLPDRLRQHLINRGIPDVLIHRYLLGWNGTRITIPITNRERQVVFFKLAKDPDEQTDSPKMRTTTRTSAEIYGWERILAKPEQLVICEGEFNRLVLEAHGIAAVTSAAGAGTFLSDWARHFIEIPKVYVCFDNDEAGLKKAERVAQLIPHSRIVSLPAEVGEGGDVSSFFVQLGRTVQDFEQLLEHAHRPPTKPPVPNPSNSLSDTVSLADTTVEALKSRVPIEILAGRYLSLARKGEHLIACCPFHRDHTPSFVVYPITQSFHCFGCQAHGDVLSLLMRLEKISFPEALQLLEDF